MVDEISRRELLRLGAAAVGAGVALAGSEGCGKETKALSCNDTTSLSASDAQVRMSLAYVDHSVEAGKSCTKCQQFIPGAPGVCGTCKVVKGPINPEGYCKSFVAKPA
jgi:hypothetical protein